MSFAQTLSALQDRWIETEIERDWSRRKERLPGTLKNRAHSAGHPCRRKLVYERLHPEEADPIDEGLWSVFREGHSQHEVIRRDLEAMGVKVLSVERPVSWPDLDLTGTIDLVLEVDGEETVWDAKGYSPHLKVRSLDDVREGPWYLRVAYWQVQLYMLLLGREGGFILKNKGTSRLHFLDVPLDFAGTEALLSRIEDVNEHVRAELLPDREVGEWCDGCEFRRVCGPPRVAVTLDQLFADGEIDKAIRDALDPDGVVPRVKHARESLREIVKDELDRTGGDSVELIGNDGRAVVGKKDARGAVRLTLSGYQWHRR